MTNYEKLMKLIEETDELIKKDITNSDIEFKTWDTKLYRFIDKVYGNHSFELRNILDIHFEPAACNLSVPEEEQDRVWIDSCRRGLKETKAILEAYLDDFIDEAKSEAQTEHQPPKDMSKVFIVHGHDGELKQEVARVIEKQDISAIILSEQVNGGRTIIEKFEKYSDVGGAICLFTADDIGKAKDSKEDKPRARQNVVFETGYFMGKLGRDHIVILSDSDVDIPSDLDGVVYTNTRNWEVDLLKELRAMGYQIDLNKL